MEISAQIIVSYQNMFRRLGRKSGVYSPRRRRKNQSPRLCFICLVIEASIARYLYICRAVHYVDARPVLRLVSIRNIAAAI